MLAKCLTWPYTVICAYTDGCLKHDQQKRNWKLSWNLEGKKVSGKVDQNVRRVDWRHPFHSLYRTKIPKNSISKKPGRSQSLSLFLLFLLNYWLTQKRPQSTVIFELKPSLKHLPTLILLSSFWSGKEGHSRMLLRLWRIYLSLASWHQP